MLRPDGISVFDALHSGKRDADVRLAVRGFRMSELSPRRFPLAVLAPSTKNSSPEGPLSPGADLLNLTFGGATNKQQPLATASPINSVSRRRRKSCSKFRSFRRE